MIWLSPTLNKFVTKQQILGMVESGFLAITSYDRSIEYVRVYGDTVIVAGSETVVWGGKNGTPGKPSIAALQGYVIIRVNECYGEFHHLRRCHGSNNFRFADDTPKMRRGAHFFAIRTVSQTPPGRAKYDTTFSRPALLGCMMYRLKNKSR